MSDLVGIDEAARACSVSRDTIKRRLRLGQFPGAIRGTPVGNRPPPWLIPVNDLTDAGLNPVVAGGVTGLDLEDPLALSGAIAHYEALAAARETHLADLRAEIRRLHDRLAELTAMVGGLLHERHRAGDCTAGDSTDLSNLPTTNGDRNGHQEEGHDQDHG